MNEDCEGCPFWTSSSLLIGGGGGRGRGGGGRGVVYTRLMQAMGFQPYLSERQYLHNIVLTFHVTLLCFVHSASKKAKIRTNNQTGDVSVAL